jgi:Zn-dependent protease
MPTRQGAVRLFRFAGVDVFLHYSWFLIAVFEIQGRTSRYSSLTWNVLEYLALFVIVLMHEYGHALACRQVGGIANQIVLWPLGGVAYVNPPPRPGATLWSIAAGPLVNVVLLPLLSLLGLLLFNILPIYPLDGGQIFRSLLWYVLGRARSLMVATIVGFAGALGLIGLAVWSQSIWLAVLSAYILMNCWGDGSRPAPWPASPGCRAAKASPVPPARPRRQSGNSGSAASAASHSIPSPPKPCARIALPGMA